ncbi:chloride channel protein [Pollutibacter soli]|uniref:chloride channel protein n=1 Tax=Pollutibacter soli TaxID=3034157 RepID=UPI003013946C
MKKFLTEPYQHVIKYLRIRFNRIQLMMLLAAITGLVSGLVAVLLKIIVHRFQAFVLRDPESYQFLIYPVVGLLTTVVVIQRLFKGKLEKGIAMVLRAIARKSSIIPSQNNYSHVLTSSLTVGLGGSAGLESPIVATGASWGSTVGRLSGVNYQERTLLIACGAAAGIASIFNAPITGIIFAIEVLMAETIVSYFIPLVVSAVVGVLCSKIILGEDVMFNFILGTDFNFRNIPWYSLLGILSGFVAVYYARVFKKVELGIKDWKSNVYLKAIIGGVILIGLYVFLPPLFGEGYDTVRFLANGTPEHIQNRTGLLKSFDAEWRLLLLAGFIVLFKPVAAAITIGSGGNGGNFAPSLFTGAYLGFFFSRILNKTGWFSLPESNFALVGMAGILSGVMYAPLTAIFLIAEITNGYWLIIPLMVVSIFSYFIVKHFEPHSMELKKLASEGEVFTQNKDSNILSAITLDQVIDKNFIVLMTNQHLGDLVEKMRTGSITIFAVVDQKERFEGLITMDEVRQYLFREDLYKSMTIKQLMKKSDTVIHSQDSIRMVMQKMDRTGKWFLPVVDTELTVIGFVSKSRIFEQYREVMTQQQDLFEETAK